MTKASTAAAATPGDAIALANYKDVEYVEIAAIIESPFQRRRDYGDMAELTASVKEHGILQPIVCRQVGKPRHDLEIVFGHRRYRAAKKLGLEVVPVLVRAMDDRTVIEQQLVENIERKAITELEEAESFNDLVKQGVAVADIAARVARSTGHVYGRLALLKLTGDLKKALLAGELDLATALQVARIPNAETQIEVAAVIMKGVTVWDSSQSANVTRPLNYREASEYISKHCMISLAGASFDRKDEKLVPKAGACTACPKRSGNDPLYEKAQGSAEVCLDPPCFDAKVKAHVQLRVAKGKEAGKAVTQKKSIFAKTSEGAFIVKATAEFIDPGTPCSVDPKKREWKEVLGKKAPETIEVIDPNGHSHKLYQREQVIEVLEKAGKKKEAKAADAPAKEVASQPDWQEQNRIDNEWRERECLEREIAIDKAAPTIIAGAADEKTINVLRMCVAHFIVNSQNALSVGAEICERRGIEGKDLAKLFASADERTLRELAGEALVAATNATYGDFSDGFRSLCIAFDLDLDALHEQAKAELAADLAAEVEAEKALAAPEEKTSPLADQPGATATEAKPAKKKKAAKK